MIKKEKITCIIQARMTSSRLPGKSMKSIIGKPAIQRVTERVKKSKLISDLWLACSDHKEDNVLENFAKANNINVFRGNMNDVLSRYVSISKMNDSGIIVRITGDCPLIDPDIIDAVIDKFIISDTDYTSNTLTRTYPDGLDVEVFSKNALYESEIIFLAVSTPMRQDGSSNLDYIIKAANSIGEYITDYKIVVVKSTVPVGTPVKIKEAIQSK